MHKWWRERWRGILGAAFGGAVLGLLLSPLVMLLVPDRFPFAGYLAIGICLIMGGMLGAKYSAFGEFLYHGVLVPIIFVNFEFLMFMMFVALLVAFFAFYRLMR